MGTTHYHLGTKNHLFITPELWVRGVVDPCPVRLADHLRNWKRPELSIRDASVQWTKLPSGPPAEFDQLLLARAEIVVAHEYVDLASDPHLRQMHQASPHESVRLYLRGFPGSTLEGRIPSSQVEGELSFLTLLDPVSVLPTLPEVEAAVRNLPYLLVQRSMVTAIATIVKARSS